MVHSDSVPLFRAFLEQVESEELEDSLEYFWIIKF